MVTLRPKAAPPPYPQPVVEGPTEAQVAAARFRAAMKAEAVRSRWAGLTYVSLMSAGVNELGYLEQN
jgi:hypothetical protein